MKIAPVSCCLGGMALYRVQFVDHGGNVYATEHVDHETDEAVIEQVRRRNVRTIGAGYDIWDGDRLVHRERH